MSFLKSIFSKKEKPVNTYADFWDWFSKHSDTFFKVVKNRNDLNTNFFDKLSPKLGELRDGIFFLAGMADDQMAELVLTPDGKVENIAFVEDLVAAAPALAGWKFLALKPATDAKNLNIRMGDVVFSNETLSFYENDSPEYPDLVDLTIVHRDFNDENKPQISNGIFIFLDNYLGELNTVTSIDRLIVVGQQDAEKELVPIEKLKDFLIWREKEFREKYEGTLYDTENGSYATFEATHQNGNMSIAIMNTDLLSWEDTASHPWILNVIIKYDHNARGMPDKSTYALLDAFEDEIMNDLHDSDGYLNLGRETANGTRDIFFACKEFRKPSKVLHELSARYAGKLNASYEIYKDKYWRSFDRFR